MTKNSFEGGVRDFVMEQIDLESWNDFENELKHLREYRAKALSAGGGASELLFRGQRNHFWPLKTTLERKVSKQTSFAEYFRLVSAARPQIETFTNLRWNIPEYPELREWAKDYDNVKLTQFPGYDYFVYLRHHGFPSPLLDWTRSPYVAAYFAFTKASSERVAIYTFWEYAGHGKIGSSNSPQIVGFGPYIRSHTRHFLQKSEYTICCFFKDGEWWYAPHEDVFAAGSDTQDRLWKFTIPASE